MTNRGQKLKQSLIDRSRHQHGACNRAARHSKKNIVQFLT